MRARAVVSSSRGSCDDMGYAFCMGHGCPLLGLLLGLGTRKLPTSIFSISVFHAAGGAGVELFPAGAAEQLYAE